MAKATVITNKKAAEGYYVMECEWASGVSLKPGEFAMLRVADGMDPLLRRPFSVYSAEKGRKRISFLYKVVGKGTLLMQEMQKGDSLDIIAPLGNSFPKVKDPSKLIMAAGGIGIAPFYLLTKELKKTAKKPLLTFGARGKNDAKLASLFKGLNSSVKISTEDGSVGVKGLITDILKKEINEDSVLYACGPMGMLKAVAVLAAEKSVKCLVSLEAGMACGMGVCLGCAVRTIKHKDKPDNALYKMVCSDGPVFDSTEIDWSSFR